MLYIVILAALSLIMSLVLLCLRPGWAVLWIIDVVVTIAWLAAFGVLKGWNAGGGKCEGYWTTELSGSGVAKCQVFEITWIVAIVAALLWFGAFVLGLVGWSRERKWRGMYYR